MHEQLRDAGRATEVAVDLERWMGIETIVVDTGSLARGRVKFGRGEKVSQDCVNAKLQRVMSLFTTAVESIHH